MRRAALLLHVHRTTIDRKLRFLGEQAKKQNLELLEKLPLVSEFQFDDLQTIASLNVSGELSVAGTQPATAA